MNAEPVNYQVDGCAMRSQLFIHGSGAGPRPGLLVFPEAFGLGAHALQRAERLAALGYAVLACDIHGDAAVHDDFETVIALIGGLRSDPKRIAARAAAGLEALAGRPEVDPTCIAAIGYCFGGTMALELARAGGAVAAVVGFHSGLAPAGPNAAPGFSAKVLVCLGSDDPSIDRAQRTAFEDEMRAAGADWQINLYGGVVHSFTNPDADARGNTDFARYDAKADAGSWAAMLQFLDASFAHRNADPA